MKLRNKTARLAATVMVSAVALTACAESDAGSGGSAGGDPIPADATKAEVQEAFAAVDPVTLNTQVPAPEGSPITKNYEDYFAAVEDWSDGKITFDVSWSNAVAGATETDDALADGRLDIGLVMAAYEPDKFPVYSALSDSSFLGTGNPLEMILSPHGYITDVGWNTPQLLDEYEQAGLKLMVPVFTGGINTILCSEKRETAEELEGAQVRISGQAHSAEAKALGMSPVSLTFEEVYQALQRGVLDCAFSGITVVKLADLLSVAPHVILDSETAFAQVPATLAFNQDKWASLPLPVQQLLWDRLDVFVEENMNSLVGLFQDVLGEVPDKGGSIIGLDDEADQKLAQGNEAFLSSVAENPAIEGSEELVAEIEDKATEWKELVAELGYNTEVEYTEFPEWAAENEVDLSDYMSEITEIQQENRPS